MEISDIDLMRYADGEKVGNKTWAAIQRALADPASNVRNRLAVFTETNILMRDAVKSGGPLSEGGGARTGIRAGYPTTAKVASMPEAGVMRGAAGRMIDPALIRTQPVNPLLQAGRFAKNWGSKVMKSPFGRFAGGVGLGYSLNEILDWRALNDIRTAEKRRLAFDQDAVPDLGGPAGSVGNWNQGNTGYDPTYAPGLEGPAGVEGNRNEGVSTSGPMNFSGTNLPIKRWWENR